MDIKIMVQSTPNPNALKFVLNVPMRNEGNVTYKSLEDANSNPMAKSVFELNESIVEVYFFDNYVTVTQNGNADWDDLENTVKDNVLKQAVNHNPDFEYVPLRKETVKASEETPDIKRINAILNETIRPALQMDGGDLQIVGFENNTLSIYYEGACGSCPSATMGTLNAIENILKNEFHPDIVVQLAESEI